jgi:hypothetical protein
VSGWWIQQKTLADRYDDAKECIATLEVDLAKYKIGISDALWLVRNCNKCVDCTPWDFDKRLHKWLVEWTDKPLKVAKLRDK